MSFKTYITQVVYKDMYKDCMLSKTRVIWIVSTLFKDGLTLDIYKIYTLICTLYPKYFCNYYVHVEDIDN